MSSSGLFTLHIGAFKEIHQIVVPSYRNVTIEKMRVYLFSTSRCDDVMILSESLEEAITILVNRSNDNEIGYLAYKLLYGYIRPDRFVQYVKVRVVDRPSVIIGDRDDSVVIDESDLLTIATMLYARYE